MHIYIWSASNSNIKSKRDGVLLLVLAQPNGKQQENTQFLYNKLTRKLAVNDYVNIKRTPGIIQKSEVCNGAVVLNITWLALALALAHLFILVSCSFSLSLSVFSLYTLGRFSRVLLLLCLCCLMWQVCQSRTFITNLYRYLVLAEYKNPFIRLSKMICENNPWLR